MPAQALPEPPTAVPPLQPPAPPAARPGRAALWMTGAVASFSAMAVAGREVSDQLDTFEIMLWRSVIGLAIVAALIAARGRWDAVPPRRPGLHLLRNLAHFTGQNAWLLALTLIPLAQVFAVEFAYPILVGLAAPLLLGERLLPAKLGAALLGFAGILMVARPWAEGGLSPGILAAFVAALGFAGSALATKVLTRSVSTLNILLWLCASQTLFSLLCAGWDGAIALPQGIGLGWALLVGLTGLAAHGCLTTALTLAPASTVAPMDFARLPVIGVVGMVLYHEPLDPWVLGGGAVILGANWINISLDSRSRP